MERKCYVQTEKDRCRVCFTCVRECPAKAIRIIEGQAEVIPERCIGCGNCVRVCSQKAKQLVKTTDEVEAHLNSEYRVAACVAPSFPSEFSDYNFPVFVGMLRGLGFDIVTGVAFGADLVADRYRRLLSKKKRHRYIAANCPAVVNYIEKYHPDLVGSLAPVSSPMVATGRAIRALYGADYKVVFVGPCIAKKVEANTDYADANISVAITFRELREMFESHGVSPVNTTPSDFDQPHPGLGSLIPISRGLLQAANIDEDLMSGDVVAADGLSDFVSAIDEFSQGHLDVQLLEILSCTGCIMGPGMNTSDPLFRRRSRVSEYARYRMRSLDRVLWRQNMDRLAGLDITRVYKADDQRIALPPDETIRSIMEGMGKRSLEDELNCGACGYHTCREHAVAIYKGIAESEMCLPYTIEKLKETAAKLACSYKDMEEAQRALIQSEKLASMGQLSAGIAHEINNPLGVVLLYAHILRQKVPEGSDSYNDLTLVVEQAERCKKIVGGLLNFARKNRVERRRVDVEQFLLRSIQSFSMPANINVELRVAEGCPPMFVDPDQMSQVILNLISNALEAMPDGGSLTISAKYDDDSITLGISDTGVGIDEESRKKIFEPFFTTKKIGKGTGLGLALVYGIVKMHNGDVKFESNSDPSKGPTGSAFFVSIPRRSEASCEASIGAA